MMQVETDGHGRDVFLVTEVAKVGKAPIYTYGYVARLKGGQWLAITPGREVFTRDLRRDCLEVLREHVGRVE